MMSNIMHDCDKDHNLNFSLHTNLFEKNVQNNTTTDGTEDETSQTKHEIFLLKRLIKMQSDMMSEYEKSIENLSRNSPRSSAGSIDSECYLELEKKIEQLRDENKRLVLECRKNNTLSGDEEDEKIYISRDVYEDLLTERKHLKSQYDVYKELFESSEAHVFNLEDSIEKIKVENKQLFNEIGKCNFTIQKLKDENNTCRMEYDDLIQQLNKQKEQEASHYELKIEQLIEEKKQALEDIESLTTIIENMKKETKDTSSTEEYLDVNCVETLNIMSKLIEELEEKFLLIINLTQYIEFEQTYEKEIMLYKENNKLYHDNYNLKQSTSNSTIKSLGEEIEEIKYREINNYNVLSSSQQSTLIESFIYLAICLLVYEFYLFILYIF